MTRRNLLMRRNPLKKYHERFTSQHFLRYDIMESANPPSMQVEFARRREPGAAAYGPRGYENISLTMESQELSIRRIMSEEVAGSELEQMERDHEFQIAVREYQRRAIDAFSQAVHQLSESYEAMMMQEFQGIQDRYEGRMEENERRVAQVIGSEAREAFTCSEK